MIDWKNGKIRKMARLRVLATRVNLGATMHAGMWCRSALVNICPQKLYMCRTEDALVGHLTKWQVAMCSKKRTARYGCWATWSAVLIGGYFTFIPDIWLLEKVKSRQKRSILLFCNLYQPRLYRTAYLALNSTGTVQLLLRATSIFALVDLIGLNISMTASFGLCNNT